MLANMLVLSRQRDERIVLGNGIVITVVDIRGDKVRLGIDAPPDVAVHREEVYRHINGESAEDVIARSRLRNSLDGGAEAV